VSELDEERAVLQGAGAGAGAMEVVLHLRPGGTVRQACRRVGVRLRAAALAVAACAAVVASLPVIGSAGAQGVSSNRVLVATTGNDSELVKTVPITRRSATKPRVVMSMGPDLLPSLSGGDRLQVTAEAEVTTDCPERMPRCVGKPYAYNPIVQAQLVLANGQLVAGGAGTLQLGAQRRRCRQNEPARVHHCVIVFTDTVLDIADRGQLPCAPGSCYLNLVVDAHNSRKMEGKKGRRNKLLIGQDEPDGTVRGDMGRLNAIRLSPGNQPPIPPLVTGIPLTASVSVRKGDDVVVFSQELSGLEKGDQLAVRRG
jgi:hypothetical protein